MSQLEVDKVIPQSGTTLTLGDSADTITIPSGATLDATNATVTYPAGSITDAAISSTAAIQQSKILGSPGFRNIVINGDMSIAQRSTSVASITTAGYYTVDRMNFNISSLGTWTMSQETDVPTGQGFAKSTKIDCTTADGSPAAGDRLIFQQRFEGQNLQYLKKGTASALSLTASFWVKSTKTGTFILELFDTDNSRTISKSYTVNTTNTWEKKTITFEGDTTGALDNDNNGSLQLNFWLGAGTDFTSGTLNTTWNSNVNANRAVGQVNIADDTANDWYITGVQLEAGTTASDFEFLPYDVNLGRCMRYYEKLIMSDVAAVGYSNSTSNAITVMTSSYIKRTSPSLTIPPAGNGAGQISFLTNAGVYPSTFGSIAVFDTNITSFSLNQTGMTGAYSGAGLGVALYGADGESIGIDAEL
jgi:hypothetical protein